MFPIFDLIDRISQATGYTVAHADEATIETMTGADKLPLVYAGHLGIKLKYPENVWENGFLELDNPQMLLTSIQFICAQEELVIVRQNIYEAIKGYTPYPDDGNYSSICFLESNVVASTSRRIWWQDIWGLIFPRIS